MKGWVPGFWWSSLVSSHEPWLRLAYPNTILSPRITQQWTRGQIIIGIAYRVYKPNLCLGYSWLLLFTQLDQIRVYGNACNPQVSEIKWFILLKLRHYTSVFNNTRQTYTSKCRNVPVRGVELYGWLMLFVVGLFVDHYDVANAVA